MEFVLRLRHNNHARPPIVMPQPADYDAHGLGPLPTEAHPRDLYIDMVKRAVLNIIYEDASVFFYDHQKEPQLSKGFSLERRVRGEDKPVDAHTMIGLRRLNNLQSCLEDVIRDRVPGDFVETGVLRGGSAIFARAILKAWEETERRVVCCDVFQSPPPVPAFQATAIQALARIPSRRWRRRFLTWIQSQDQHKMFPDDAEMSDGFATFSIWTLQNLRALRNIKGASLDDVKTNFARYGLLDEQVVFLEGFFADTLPDAPIDEIAILRLDGDTYDSTMDAIEPLYPKLSTGGYCIVDDYKSFYGCERAIHEYRDRHGITDEIVTIDNLAVYWRKSLDEESTPVKVAEREMAVS